MATAATETSKNYIGGEWVDASGDETFETTNPATGETIGTFPRSTGDDVDRAVEAAKEAYEAWRLTPAPEARRDPLPGRAAVRRAQGRADRADGARDGQGARRGRRRRPGGDRHDLLHGRRGPPPLRPDDAVGDARQVPDERAHAGRGRRRDHAVELPHRHPELEDRARARLRQHGRLQARARHADARPALRGDLRGGRPARRASSTSSTAAARQVGERLVKHPDVPLISLTGSREVGITTAQNGAAYLKHIHLELGGKNAIIVMDDADLDLAVEGIVWSAFGTSGQRCTAASRVIAGKQVYDALIGKLVERTEKLRLGDGLEDSTDVGPVVNRSALEKIHSYTEIGKDEGADAPHRRGDRHGERARQGLLLPPDDLRRRRAGDADRAGGDLRPDHRAHQGDRRRRGDRGSRTASSSASRRRSSRAT